MPFFSASLCPLLAFCSTQSDEAGRGRNARQLIAMAIAKL
jgi:hypothetical protein